MNKLEVNSPVFTLASEAERRLIVLVPDADADISSAARKIWVLAEALGGRIQLLGLCKDEGREPSLRRRMIALSSMVGGESKVEFGGDWLTFVKSNWREGDVIVCLGGQQVGFAKRPLSQILESNLGAVVYAFPETQTLHPRPHWISSAMSWAGSLAIVALFFWGQAKLAASQDWAHTTLLYFSLFIETGVLWVWNRLFV
jgi:hypothetical protein